MLIRMSVCVGFAAMLSGCGSSADPAPAGCLTTWTAVSANTAAVQLSPASGTGRSQVELFVPANTGDQRPTLVTIAGQTATITQAGRLSGWVTTVA